MLTLLKMNENVRNFFLNATQRKRMLFAAFGVVLLVLAACSHHSQDNANTGIGAKKNSVTDTTKQPVTKKAQNIEKTTFVPATPEKLKQAVFSGLSLSPEQGKQRFTQFTINQTNNAVVKYKVYQDLNPSLTVFRSKQDIANMLWGIKKANLDVNEVNVIVTNTGAADQSGKAAEQLILDVIFTKESIQKTDFESYNTDNILYIANKINFKNPAYVW